MYEVTKTMEYNKMCALYYIVEFFLLKLMKVMKNNTYVLVDVIFSRTMDSSPYGFK